MLNKNYESEQPDSHKHSPMPSKNNTSIVSATNIGDMSITRDNHSSAEKEPYASTGTKMVHPSMEKIKEECDETEFAEAK